MMISRRTVLVLALLALTGAAPWPALHGQPNERHLLYVAVPGIRNYVEYGGVGVLVYDVANGHRFVKRIPTFDVPAGQEPENIKGIAASPRDNRLFIM
jgi:predicted aconitase